MCCAWSFAAAQYGVVWFSIISVRHAEHVTAAAAAVLIAAALDADRWHVLPVF